MLPTPTVPSVSAVAETAEVIELPPFLAMAEKGMASWFDAMLACTDQFFHWWCLPFGFPHHHETIGHDQLEIPDVIEEAGEHDLFA